MDLKELIKTTPYNFLREHKNLGERTVLVTLGGSHAYGTAKKDGTSDVDIRGIALERAEDLNNKMMGFAHFEQVIDKPTDTTIYGINKVIHLLMNSNPNVIELLGGREQDYLVVKKEGQLLLDNKDLFISQKCIGSFGGYANQQLNRLGNAIARDRLEEKEKLQHIKRSLESAMLSFDTRYTSFGNKDSIKLYVGPSSKKDIKTELFLNMNMSNYPLKDTKSILDEMNQIVKDYERVNHRNSKKDEEHLDKHAMHLIRLYLMCLDILEKGEIVTYRADDLDLLMGIRAGNYRLDNGSYHSSFFELIDSYSNRLEYAKKHTTIPKEPNIEKIKELTFEINKQILLGR